MAKNARLALLYGYILPHFPLLVKGLSVNTKKIHDFSMPRLIGTSVLSLAGVAAIVFLAITIVILVQQFGGFIVTVASEILTL